MQELLGITAVIMIDISNVDIPDLEIGSQRHNDQLYRRHQEHHCQDDLIPEYLAKFFLQYKAQYFHDNRILNRFNAMVSNSTDMPDSISVSFQT